MKLMLLWALLSPSVALACDPAPIPECKKEQQIDLDEKSFLSFKEKVSSFHKLLYQAVRESDKQRENPWAGRTSCFNDGFAPMFASETHQYAKKNGNKICPAQVDLLKRTAMGMIRENSDERKAVTVEKFKPELEKSAKAVSLALKDFLKHHRKPPNN